jgi:4-amino-4-deoxy-L-arabinose transferase-like glycosyltransferase
MGAVFPLAALPLLVGLFLAARQEWRSAMLAASVVWGVTIVALVEALSGPHLLTAQVVGAVWVLIDLVLVALLMSSAGLLVSSLRLIWGIAMAQGSRLGYGAVGLFISMVIGLTALMSAPNVADALDYHLPRVVHWIWNGSVAFYPTYETRQLHMAPWSEYAILQVHLLSGGDVLDNLVQWACFVGCAVAVSKVAAYLGAAPVGQWLSGVIALTIPEGVLQASSATNDCCLAFWLVVAARYLFAFARSGSPVDAVGLGAAAGLAILTKGTALVFGGPLVVALLPALPKSPSRWRSARATPLVFLVAVAINAPQFSRNWDLYGNPLGPETEEIFGGSKYTNDRFGIDVLTSNILRNAALHLGTPSDRLTFVADQVVQQLVRLSGSDPNDPATTWAGTSFQVPAAALREELAGNPVHLALACAASVLALRELARVRRNAQLWVFYACGTCLAFLTFAALFKWQPWNTRLHLPLFELWAPVFALLLSRTTVQVPMPLMAATFVLLALPALVANQLRPLVPWDPHNVWATPRADQYFYTRPQLRSEYTRTATHVRNSDAANVALDLSQGEGLEYLWIVLLGPEKWPVQYSDVRNSSMRYGVASDPGADAVICSACAGVPITFETYARRGLHPEIFDQTVVYASEE